jgi:ribosomal-protein-alanine N-acetyltransferase
LRPPAAADYQEFTALMKRNQAFFRSLVPTFKGRASFDEWITRNRFDDYFGFVICRREDGIIIGKVNLFQIIRRGLQSANVGYLISREHTRNGYATEALELMLRFAFCQVKLHRVEADIQPPNKASLALVRGAGFTREGFSPRYVKIGGRWRDHERWALRVEDWRKSAAR